MEAGTLVTEVDSMRLWSCAPAWALAQEKACQAAPPGTVTDPLSIKPAGGIREAPFSEDIQSQWKGLRPQVAWLPGPQIRPL